MNKQEMIEQIKASTRRIKCDLIIKNITIVDIFNNDTFMGDVGIKNGYIIGIGDYEGQRIIDGKGKYICPGLIDAHCHIESSLVTPKEYAKVALLNGVTSVIADPHEIANVMGEDGIKFMLKDSANIPFDMYFMLPSCVPGTSFENSGARLLASNLRDFYNEERVLGLAEVMDYESLFSCEETMIDKIYDAINNNTVIDGHGAGFSSDMINSYRVAKVLTDHECISPSDAIDRIRRGMYVLIREGTAAKNLIDILSAVNESNISRFCLCTDDKHIDDIKENGSINYSVRKCIECGLKPEMAIKMATINTSLVYNLQDKGAIAPGYKADFIILDDLKTFKINSVYKSGELVAENGDLVCDSSIIKSKDNKIVNTVNFKDVNKESFRIDITNKDIINVIEIIPNKLETNHIKVKINNNISESIGENKYFKASPEEDLLKIAVVERHKKSGNIGLGVLKGLKIKSGAIGTTIAHDSHNIILVGTNDRDLLIAANELKSMGGGIVVVKDGKIIGSIKLEIGGLMTNRNFGEVKVDLDILHKSMKDISPDINYNPFLTLSFLSLPVIPDLKITDKGLFDVKKFKFINVSE